MANGDQGFLESFGLTNLTTEELGLQRGRARARAAGDEASQRARGRSQSTQIASRLGGIVGSKASEFFNPDALVSNPEQRRIEAVQAAQQRVSDASARNPKLQNLPNEAKQNVFQQILADELAQRGEVSLGLQVGADLEQKRRSQEAQRIELRKLGISEDRQSAALEAERNSLTRDRRGEVTTVFPVGSDDPNSGQTAFIQNDGTAVTPEGETIPLGEFVITRPVTDRRGKLTAADFGVSKKEQSDFRKQASSVMSQARGAIQMADILQESADQPQGITIMDGTGKASTAVSKTLEVLGGIANETGASLRVTDAAGREKGNLALPGAASNFIDDNFAEIDNQLIDLVPAPLRKTAELRARYYSTLTRITYEQARAQEPGARQLSDADFKNALAVMAANAADPEAFRQVMIGNMNSNVEKFNDQATMLGEAFPLIMKPGGIKRFDDVMNQFNTRFAEPFGSPTQPGPGLSDLPTPPTQVAPGGTVQVGGATVKFID